MTITYNATDNIITLDGTNTYSFEDIYQADQNGGWGVVSKQGDDQYYIEANITLGDGTNETQLIDEDCAIQLGTNANQRWMETKVNSIFKLTTSYFEWYAPAIVKYWYSETYIYNSVVYRRGNADDEIRFMRPIEILNSYIDSKGWYIYSGKVTIKESVFSLASSAFWLYSGAEHDINDLTLKNGYWGFILGTGKEVKAKNLTIKDCTIDIRLAADNATLILVNSSFDKTKLQFQYDNDILYDKFEFDIKVMDKDGNVISGANVELYDKNDNLIFEEATDENGEISTHEITYRKFEGINETETIYTPHTLKITKDGYATYKAKITINHKIEDDIFVLDALSYTYDDIMKIVKAIYVK